MPLIRPDLFVTVCFVWMGVAAAVFVAALIVPAPYGRHTRSGFGLMIPNRSGWIAMEAVSFLIMLGYLVFGEKSRDGFAWVLFLLWLVHYANRAFVYPLRTRTAGKVMPAVIMVSAIFFNVVNAGLNGYYLAFLAPSGQYGSSWISGPRFLAGLLLFIGGMAVNGRADNILLGLRKPGETGYSVPRGFLFEYVSAPNLLGEIIEWAGFALMAWNPAASCFFVWTAANLIPRAKNHHDWYKRNFPDYPKNRKAIIPGIF